MNEAKRLRKIPRILSHLSLLPLRSVFAIVLIAQLLGCAGPELRESREVAKGINQAEIQQDVQRFAGVFMDRIAQSLDVIAKSKTPQVRIEGVRRALLYSGSAIEIATSPSPELGLLDMIVFVTLARSALEKHWIPHVLKDEGKMLSVAFARSEPEIWRVGAKVMNNEQLAKLHSLIDHWKQDNIGQYRVENVRLGEFSRFAGQRARERAEQSQGLLASISRGVETADQAVLLADRAFFLAQRMPFLVRMHAVLGTGELLGAVSNQLNQDALLRESARAALDEGNMLVLRTGEAAREGRRLVEALHPLILPKRYQLGNYLAAGNDLTERLIGLVDRLNAVTPAAVQRMERLFVTAVAFAVAGGVVLIAAWWVGYFHAKRRLNQAPHSENRKEAA